jgi:KEOPS complex subunit Cgi121
MNVVEGVHRVADVDAYVERLDAIREKHGVTMQAFDARYVVDREHLERAVQLADRAIERGEAIARDRAVEILCYAAGRRQINRALQLGVGEGECPVVVLVDAPTGAGKAHGSAGKSPDTVTGKGPNEKSEPGRDSENAAAVDGPSAERERAAAAAVRALPAFEPAETLGEYDPERVRDTFDITEAELATVDGDLASLVHERVALLVIEK